MKLKQSLGKILILTGVMLFLIGSAFGSTSIQLTITSLPFNDGFESGNINLHTGPVTSSGSLAVTTTNPKTGSYALEFITDSSTWANGNGVYDDVNVVTRELSLTYDILFGSLPLQLPYDFNWMRSPETFGLVFARLFPVSGGYAWGFNLKGTAYQGSLATVAVNVYYTVKLTVNLDSGTVQVFVNGNLQASTTTDLSSESRISQVRAWAYKNEAPAARTFRIDNVLIETSSTPSPTPTPTPTPAPTPTPQPTPTPTPSASPTPTPSTPPVPTPPPSTSNDTVTLTVSVYPENGGITSPTPGTYEYAIGSSVVLSATAFEGYHFSRWVTSDSAEYSNASISLTLDESLSIRAEFAVAGSQQVPSSTFGFNPLQWIGLGTVGLGLAIMVVQKKKRK